MAVVTSSIDVSLRVRSLERRRQALRAQMRALDLDLVIAYGSGLHSFIHMNPAWYISGFKQLGRHMAVLLPVDGEPSAIITPTWDLARARARSTIDDVQATDEEQFMSFVAEQVNKRGLRGKTVGVSGGEGHPRAIADAWPGLFDRGVRNVDQVLTDLAKIRDEWSLDCTRRAVSIAEQGYLHLLETARPGMPEHEVAGELDVCMRELGADDNFQLMSASMHNRGVHAPTNRILEVGDVLLGEITPAVEGEYIQICRTAVLGKPSALQLEKFALLDQCLRDGMRTATPGTPVKAVVAAINKPLDEAGYSQYTRPPYMRTRGHSMSLGAMEPEIAPDRDHVLMKNEVFVMHPNQYIPETGYFMCGEPVIITDNGAVNLTSTMGRLDSIVS
jgi:Xaa-Pro dipeptidase